MSFVGISVSVSASCDFVVEFCLVIRLASVFVHLFLFGDPLGTMQVLLAVRLVLVLPPVRVSSLS